MELCKAVILYWQTQCDKKTIERGKSAVASEGEDEQEFQEV
jgi:hypothetical protein